MKKRTMGELLADRRRLGCALALGLCCALFMVLGMEMRSGGFHAPWWRLAGLFVLYTVGFGALSWLALGFWKRQGKQQTGKETWLSRASGNGLVVFLLLAACWIPAWLAYWPGLLNPDTLSQFESFYNEDPSAHHPLLHTALLGFCMTLGIDLHPEGYATYGVALYCGVQLVLLAASVAYACHWLGRRGAPLWARVAVTLVLALSPVYAPWAASTHKDVLFGAAVLVFCLQLTDLWRFGLKPLRCAAFAASALWMMALRNNGVYALALLIPFAAAWARKGKRLQLAALLVVCALVYVAGNQAVIAALDAQPSEKVEILSIPLQQIARTLRDHPEAAELDEDGLLDTLYFETSPAEAYHPQIADPVKWAADYETLEENLPALLVLWGRIGIRYPQSYLEAFLVQNLPYYLPGSPMLYNFDLKSEQPEWFPVEEHSYLPGLREVYEAYDQTLCFAGIPGTRLLSHPATLVWLCLFGFVCAVYRRRRGLMSAFLFLLVLWITCLLGPVAILRYVLGLFYAVPVLLCALLTPQPQTA